MSISRGLLFLKFNVTCTTNKSKYLVSNQVYYIHKRADVRIMLCSSRPRKYWTLVFNKINKLQPKLSFPVHVVSYRKDWIKLTRDLTGLDPPVFTVFRLQTVIRGQ